MAFTTLFIDDCFGRPETDSRRQKVELLKAISGITVEELDPVKLFEFKRTRKNSLEPFDLIFIDYKLSTDTGDVEVFSTGDQCESLVRSMCSDAPIYLLSVTVEADKEMASRVFSKFF